MVDLLIRASGADAQVRGGAGNIVTVRDAAGMLDAGDFVFLGGFGPAISLK